MQLTNLYRYPVKSLRGQSMVRANVERIGLEGDRRWLVVDSEGTFQTIRQIPKMAQVIADITSSGLRLSHPAYGTCDVAYPGPGSAPTAAKVWRDTVQAPRASDEAGSFLSRILGRTVHLLYLANPAARPVDRRYGAKDDRVSFADGFPMLLTSTASLDDLSSRIGREISVRRFRPNLVIAGADPWAEDMWREIRIGAIRFRVVKPCGRCIVTTRDPDTGDVIDSQEPLRTLGSYHRDAGGDIIFGQNIIPDDTGEIAVGDTVEVLKWGPSNLLG